MKLRLFLLGFLIVSQLVNAQSFGVSASQQPKCFGECNGSITFTTSQFSGPFTCSVTNSSGCPNSTVQASSGSSITVSDICACSSTYTFTIYDASLTVVGSMIYQFPVYATSLFTVNTPTVGAASCYSCCDGYAYITYGGGNTNGSPTFTLDGVLISGISPASTLCPGSHTVCGADPSDCVACKVFTVNAPANGFKEYSAADPAKIYPVPASEMLNIEPVSQDPISKIEIRDVSGRLVETLDLKGSSVNIQVNLRNMNAGLYFLAIYREASVSPAYRHFVISR
jgi:hypothetical protein